jgi:hypothetical protein
LEKEGKVEIQESTRDSLMATRRLLAQQASEPHCMGQRRAVMGKQIPAKVQTA